MTDQYMGPPENIYSEFSKNLEANALGLLEDITKSNLCNLVILRQIANDETVSLDFLGILKSPCQNLVKY